MEKREEIIETLFQSLKDAGNIGVLHTNGVAQKVGLSATEFECLSLVIQFGPLSAGELAARCGVTTGGMTGLMDRLEKCHLIQRGLDPHDRRRIIVESIFGKRKDNKEIMDKLQALYRPLQNSFYEVVEQYTDEELRVIAGFYSRMNDATRSATVDLSEK